ncbi:MAG: urease accessory UreF family protein [Porticoccaceae bacterium]|nr:urease accessory UreF family protein [Porticoccaceae bacterium]
MPRTLKLTLTRILGHIPMGTVIKVAEATTSRALSANTGVSNTRTSNPSTPHPAMLFQLLRFSSPSLPIGGFAWSQGLESAIDLGWLKHEKDLHGWLLAMLEQGFANQELPLLLRMLGGGDGAEQGLDRLVYWNYRSLALRESAELRLEDVQMGRALLQLSLSLNIDGAKSWPAEKEIGYLAAFALACGHYSIDFEAAATGYIWSWLDNQIAAAIKLFPLGQTSGQLLIEQLAPVITAVLDTAKQVADDDVGISLQGQVMASMLHESQYSRMFRS